MPQEERKNRGGDKPRYHSKNLLTDQHFTMKKVSKRRTPPDTSDLPEGIWLMPDGTYKCVICDLYGLKSLCGVTGHCKGKSHTRRLDLEDNVKQKEERKRAAAKLKIESDGKFDAKREEHSLSVTIKEGEPVSKKMTFLVRNICPDSSLKLIWWGKTAASQEIFFPMPEDGTVILNYNMAMTLTIEMEPKFESVHAFKLYFQFRDLNKKSIVLYFCDVKISFVSEMTADLSATGGYVKPKKIRVPPQCHGPPVRGLRPPNQEGRDRLERDRPLADYAMPVPIQRFINDGLAYTSKSYYSPEAKVAVDNYKVALEEEELTFFNYEKRFGAILYMEEHQTQVDTEEYFMKNVEMHRGFGKVLSLEVPGLAENRPSVLRGDQILVRQYFGEDNYGPREYQGFVHEVQQTRVFMGFGHELLNKFHKGMKFCVRFTLNRHPSRLQHRALSLIDESDLKNVLFPTEDTARTDGTLMPPDMRIRFFARNPEPNTEQARAIAHIVMGTSRPAPYIVFGPPGTGKTFTIVEAIKQVVTVIPGARVLACAPSNSAADLIAERLLDHLQKRQVYRMNAYSRSTANISKKIMQSSNIVDGDTDFPSRSQLTDKGIRVFVTTLITAGRLATANFAHDYFTHLFIDEASHATEPESLVAMAGLMHFNNGMDTARQIVMAGDPKQLGPIIRSPLALKMKLDVSLMERLMSSKLYKRRDSPEDGVFYDPMLLTKLVRNYRSHDAILAVPNKLFYNDELRTAGMPEITHRLCKWERLPNLRKPVIFHAVVGEDMRDNSSPSFYNPMEANIVLQYVGWLLHEKAPTGFRVKEEHIGIITPYRKQVKKIGNELKRRGLPNIKVGSVEEFQGQERLIIIVSTVRSNPRFLQTDNKFGIGFLKNDKRFNVAVTRAKALLVVVGNPIMIQQNKSWKCFVEYCRDNHCMVYQNPDLEDEDENFLTLDQMYMDTELETEMELKLDLDSDNQAIDSAKVSAINNEEMTFERDL